MQKGLVFFPWFAVAETMDLGQFRLVPYRRNNAPFGHGTVEQQECDAVLELYHETRVAPVRQATVLHRLDRAITAPVSDEEGVAIAEWGELVALSALAARRYFSQTNYVSRESLRLVAVGYSDPQGGIQEWRRRRDGYTNMIVSRDVAQVVRPLHAYAAGRSSIDLPLLKALLAERPVSDRARMLEAIHSFNAASTDDSGVAEEFEVVAMIGAFERLLGLRGGDENELAAALVKLLDLQDVVLPRTSAKLSIGNSHSRHADRRCLTDVWIRDFFRQRGRYAHGQKASGMPTIWSMREHLLFASFLFPLAVKRLLAQDGSYVLSDTDSVDLRAAEHLLNLTDVLAVSPAPGETHPWNKVFDELYVKELAEKIVTAYMQEQTTAEPEYDPRQMGQEDAE